MVSYSDWYVIYLTYNYRMEAPVLNLILSCQVPNALKCPDIHAGHGAKASQPQDRDVPLVPPVA